MSGFNYDKEDNLVGATTDYGLKAQTDARNSLTSVTDARSATTNSFANMMGI